MHTCMHATVVSVVTPRLVLAGDEIERPPIDFGWDADMASLRLPCLAWAAMQAEWQA
jgi:hypothetical protein